MPTQVYRTKAGIAVPSVTTIISNNLGWGKDALMGWAHSQGMKGIDYREKTKEATNAGTLAHLMIECDLKEMPVPDDAIEWNIKDKEIGYAQNAYENFLKWKAITKFQVVGLEVPLVSESLEYGGCVDAICILDNKYCIVDWKASNKGTYPSYYVQVSAYANLWNENNPDNPITGGAHILRIDKYRKEFTHSFYADLSEGITTFKLLRELDRMRQVIG